MIRRGLLVTFALLHACGPRAASDEASAEHERGDFGTGQAAGEPVDSTGLGPTPTEEYDPFDCVAAIVAGDLDAVLVGPIDDGEACMACAPVFSCTSDGDCAAGAHCANADFTRPGPARCIRECSGDGDCSEGRRCVSLDGPGGESVDVCATPFNDPYACSLASHGTHCSGLDDRTACEALVSTHNPTVGCSWIEEHIVASGDSCDPIAVDGYCAATAPHDANHPCRADESCNANGVEVRWREFGAGTASFLALPPNRRLMRGLPLDPPDQDCSFTEAVALPAVCGCVE
ncbi:MAG: hypothetical protein AAF721_25445 [Myxococcota bacterium]